MQFLSRNRLAAGILAGLALLLIPQSALPQEPEPTNVKFETVDQVTLFGKFYPSSKGKKAATVLILHQLGAGHNSQAEEWDHLAKKLQESGLAVLRFDFRGHGQSTSVGTGFWDYPYNQKLVKGFNPANPKANIDVGDFNRIYFPMLINDIYAAKMFLDRRNDAGECNSANLILIGAEEGAALGAMFMHGEWNRCRTIQVNPFNGLPLRWENRAEGQGVFGAFWLSPASSIGGFSRGVVNLPMWLRLPGLEKRTPMAFIYGDQDMNARGTANQCVNYLTANGQQNKDIIVNVPIKGTRLAGHKLLTPNLGTADLIVNAAKKLLEARVTNDWATTDTERVGFVWAYNQGIPYIAKTDNEKAFRVFRVDHYKFLIPGLPLP